MTRLCVVGLSHRTASVELRERANIPAPELLTTLERLRALPGVEEVMVVSTCNRVEVYAAVSAAEGVAEGLRRALWAGRKHAEEIDRALYVHEDQAALRHLFRVASSLDSMVVGESQILGQVKAAFQLAVEAGTVGTLLQRAVPHAFSVAKRVRSETEVARSSASVASVAVELARQIFGELAGRAVLVVGAGKMGDLSAKHLKAAGVNDLHVVNRTAGRAEELAARLGGRAHPWEELDRLLQRADIVLCSTGAPEPVIRADRVERVMKARRGRWLFFIDIAVPRDVEPEVGELENVYLYDVDALEQVVATNLEGRQREADAAGILVEEELQRHLDHQQALGAVPTIKLLRARFAEVAALEVERTLSKLSSTNERDRQLVTQLGEAIINKLLHTPLSKLKRETKNASSSDDLAALVRQLFDLHTGLTGTHQAILDDEDEEAANRPVDKVHADTPARGQGRS